MRYLTKLKLQRPTLFSFLSRKPPSGLSRGTVLFETEWSLPSSLQINGSAQLSLQPSVPLNFPDGSSSYNNPRVVSRITMAQ